MKQHSKILTVTDSDFHLIGIASHENDYRLAWAINTALNFALVKSSDVVVFHDKYKHDINLSLFIQEFTEPAYVIKLFANRGDNFFLFEDLKNIDYFIKLEGVLTESKIQSLIQKLKSIDIVMGVYLLDINNIRKIERINF